MHSYENMSRNEDISSYLFTKPILGKEVYEIIDGCIKSGGVREYV